MFQALTKANQLRTGNPESNIAICCLWMPRERVAAMISPRDYAVIGNLYSVPRGIPYLLQNLLANPQIRNLVLLTGQLDDAGKNSIDRSGSGAALIDFWSGAYHSAIDDQGRAVWQIESAQKESSFIGPDLFPREMLDNLRRNVHLWTARDLKGLEEIVSQYGRPFTGSLTSHNTQALGPWGEPIKVQLPEAVPEDVLPAQNSGFLIRGKTIAELWPQILYNVMRFGKLNESHYDDVHMEALNLMAVLDSEDGLLDVDFGDRTYGYLPGRYQPTFKDIIPEWIQATNSDLRTTETFREYCEKVLFGEGSAEEVENLGVVKYTYGDRIRWWFDDFDQIEDVVQKLAREPIAKSAVVSLWDPTHDHKSPGSPCLNHLWFRIVDSRLSMSVVIRSNDMYGAWPANAYSLRVLQSLVMTGINTRLHTLGEPQVWLGTMTILSESAHIYGDSFDPATDVIQAHYAPVVKAQAHRFDDPKGSFVVRIESYLAVDGLQKQGILCEHIAPGDGRILGTYRSRSAKGIYRQLAEANVITDLYHALDIGAELQKAEDALMTGAVYTQDQRLNYAGLNWAAPK